MNAEPSPGVREILPVLMQGQTMLAQGLIAISEFQVAQAKPDLFS